MVASGEKIKLPKNNASPIRPKTINAGIRTIEPELGKPTIREIPMHKAETDHYINVERKKLG